MKEIARMVKVTCQYDYQIEHRDETNGAINEVSTWYFGSWEGAYEFCNDEKKIGLQWFSMEDQSFLPCNEENPNGKLYIGCNRFYAEFLQEDGTWK